MKHLLTQECVKGTFWTKLSTNCCFVFSQKQSGICGPWIPDDGKIVTHTLSKAGKMTQKYWTSNVRELEQNFSKEPVIFNMCWGLNNCSISQKNISWEHLILCVVRRKSSCSIRTIQNCSIVQYCMFWVCSSLTLTLLSERDSSWTQANKKHECDQSETSFVKSDDISWHKMAAACNYVCVSTKLQESHTLGCGKWFYI